MTHDHRELIALERPVEQFHVGSADPVCLHEQQAVIVADDRDRQIEKVELPRPADDRDPRAVLVHVCSCTCLLTAVPVRLSPVRAKRAPRQ
jgi:hypothetical protein